MSQVSEPFGTHWVQKRVEQRVRRPRRLRDKSPEQVIVSAFAKTNLTLSFAQVPTHTRSTVAAPQPVARTGRDHGLFVFTGPHIHVAVLLPVFSNVSTPDGFTWERWDDFHDVQRANALLHAIKRLTVHAPTAADLLDRVAALIRAESPTGGLWVDHLPALTGAVRDLSTPEGREAIDLLAGLGAFVTDERVP